MRRLSRLALGALAVGQQQSGEPNYTTGHLTTNYIVEYADENAARLSSTADVKVVKTFDSDVFTGASIETAELSLDDLQGLPGVVNVWPNDHFYLEPSAKPEESVGIGAAAPSVAHTITGVSKLHEQGFFGKGVKIGVIDTGIWYKHDALGGGFGEGFKVAGGYDFAGDGDWKHPDEDPLDLDGHGTHVAGIIAGKTDDFVGVAPDATLYAYKVMNHRGGIDSAAVIKAFEAAYKDRVDVITCSLGFTNGWAENPIAVLASRIVKHGVVVVNSANNSGSEGPFYSSGGSSGKNVLAVASADVTYTNTTRASSFTSWGLLNDLGVKPDVAAPGASIYSTYLDNSWKVESGTSMAAPYVAGVAALYIGAFGGHKIHGKGFALALIRQIIATAGPLAYHDSMYTELAAPVPQVGNGFVNASKLFSCKTTLDYEPIALNDTRHFNGHHHITVTNTGPYDVSYHLSSQDAYGVETLLSDAANKGKKVKLLSELVPQKLAVEVSLPDDFTLKPGENKTVSVNFKNPDTLGWNATVLPLYSGKIIVSGDNGEDLSVPYAGVAADLRKEFHCPFSPGIPELVYIDPAERRGVSFIFNLNASLRRINRLPWTAGLMGHIMRLKKDRLVGLSKRPTRCLRSVTRHTAVSHTAVVDADVVIPTLTFGAEGLPKIVHDMIWGTRELRWDIFEAGWTERRWAYPPVVGMNGYIGSAVYYRAGSGQEQFHPNNTFPYPRINLPRSNSKIENYWTGKLSNGNQIAVGNYTLRYAILKLFGNPENSDDWATFTTPFEVLGSFDVNSGKNTSEKEMKMSVE